MIKVLDNSKDGIYNSNMELVDSFTDYSSKNLDFDKPVTIELMDDEENAKNPLGTTAHYNPDEMKITIYVTGRHIKDILRSISHELIHHVQNCRGDLSGMQDTSLGYAQRDKHMRDMETEAFNSGNIMNFRDFEDNYKQRNRKMSKLQENRLKKLNGLLMEQSRGEQLKNIANALVKNMEGYVSADNLKTVIRGLKLINNSNEYKVVDALFKKDYGKNLRDAITSVSTFGFPETRRNIGDAIGLIDSIKRSVTLDAPADPQSRGLQATRPPAKAAPKGKGQRLVRDPVTGEMVPLAPDAQATPRGRVKYRKCTKNFKKGCAGDNIKTIQGLLYLNLKDTFLKGVKREDFVDGKFWTATDKAVRAFQKANKLGVDGVVGKNTLAKLTDKQVARMKSKRAEAAPKGAAVPPAAAPAVAPEDIPVDVELTPRQAVQTAMKMMKVTPRRPWSNKSSELAGRTVLHYMKKGDSPAKAYEKALKIFGLQGRLTKLGPVSGRVWMRSFLDKLGIMSVDDLPKLPRLPTE
jgi:peptidoglycan hydrolase-like protein with peptidoglycan-binding domain